MTQFLWRVDSLRGLSIEARLARVREINRDLVPIRQAVVAVGCDAAPLEGDIWVPSVSGYYVAENAVHVVEVALGAYEHLKERTGLVSLPSAPQPVDIEGALVRALRTAFKLAPPANEKAVQDQVEVILRSIAVRFTRDQDVVTVGTRTYKPDFVVDDQDLAMEVKYTRPGGLSESRLNEELAADILAYGTRWKRFLVIVYDVGVLGDPGKLQEEHMATFGVSVVVVKH